MILDESFDILLNPFHVEFHYRFLAGFGHQEVIIVYVGHKEDFCQDARRQCVLEDEEAGIEVGVAVGGVFAQEHAGAVAGSGVVEAGGESVG